MTEAVTPEEAKRLCSKKNRINFDEVAKKMGVTKDYLRNNELNEIETAQLNEIVTKEMRNSG